MGAGKTFVGKQLSTATGLPFVDLDDWIEEAAQQSISAIFEEKGEEYFRRLEQSCLHRSAEYQNLILSCGGGTPCFFDNMEWIKKQGFSIYLQVPPTIIAYRLAPEMAHRPVLKGLTPGNLEIFIQRKLAEREAYYLMADVIYKVKANDDPVAMELLKHLPDIIGH